MKRTIALAGIFAIFMALAPQILSSHEAPFSVKAQSFDQQDERAMRVDQRGRICSVSSLKGPYGVLLNGQVLNWSGWPKGPIVGIAIMDFDGAGKYTSYANTADLNGFYFNQPDFSGTYSVNSDCTGTVLSPLGVFSFVLDDDGREYNVLWGLNAGQVIAGRVVKIAPNVSDLGTFDRARSFYCNPGLVAGSYSVLWRGSMINSPPQSPDPIGGVTLFTHGNDATITGKGILDFNGNKEPVNILITSTVNSNCTFSGVSTTGERYVGVFVSGADEYFILALPPTTIPNVPGQGKVMFGVAKRVNPNR